MMNQIKKIKRETERKFLLDVYRRKQIYSEQCDNQALEGLITRVNGIYDGMSDESQRISSLLINEIMHEVRRCEE